MITKPLLADSVEEVNDLVFPLACTPKIDGIRCLKINGNVVSRRFKPIPNTYIREKLNSILMDNMDGEILSGDTFQDCSSQVMSHEGSPSFTYHLFDWVPEGLDVPYMARMKKLEEWYETCGSETKSIVKLVLPKLINSQAELAEFEGECLEANYEGVMLRRPDGPYKCGRSTVKQAILMKLKRFADSEATIVGFEPKMHNANVANKDVFGRTERSSHKENLVALDTLGSLQVKDKLFDIEFNIGTGLDDKLRKEIWDNKSKYLGRLVKYKYFQTGTKDAPRFPVFLGFRDEIDM